MSKCERVYLYTIVCWVSVTYVFIYMRGCFCVLRVGWAHRDVRKQMSTDFPDEVRTAMGRRSVLAPSSLHLSQSEPGETGSLYFPHTSAKKGDI